MTLITPSIPLIKNEFNVSSDLVQLVLTFYLIFVSLGQIVFGSLSDRYGRRPLILFGSILYMLGGILSIFSNSLSFLILCRIIQALGAAACMSIARVIVNDSFSKNEAASKLSIITAVMVIFPQVGLILGGFITEFFGWKGTMTILFIFGSFLFIGIYFFIPETLLKKKLNLSLSLVFKSYYSVITDKLFFNFTLISALQSGIFFSFFAFLPYEFFRIGLSPLTFGIWFSFVGIGYFIGNIANGFYAKKLGINIMCLSGCIISCISLICMFLFSYLNYNSPIFISIPFLFFGFGNGITVANSIIGALSNTGSNAGAATGLAGAMQMAAGGVLGSFIITMGGDDSFLVAMIIVIILSFIAVYNSVLIMRYKSEK